MKKIRKIVALCVMAVIFVIAGNMKVSVEAATAADYHLTVSTNRATNTCNYSLSGIGQDVTNMELLVSYTNAAGQSVNCLDQNIALNQQNCVNGVYNGQFTIDELSNPQYTTYKLYVIINGVTVVGEQECDFRVHASDYSITVGGNQEDVSRTLTWKATLTSAEGIVPGSNPVASVYIWKKGADEASAVKASDVALSGDTFTCNMDMAAVTKGNGTYNAKVMLVNGTKVASMGATTFEVNAVATDFYAKTTKSLEKKGVFAVSLKELRNPVEVKEVSFHVYNQKGEVLYTKKAQKKNDGNLYYAEIALKDLKNQLDKFSIKAYMVDVNGNTSVYQESTSIDQRATAKSLNVVKNKAARTTVYQLKNPSVPGGVKGVSFWIYYKKNGDYKLLEKIDGAVGTNKKAYKASIANKYVGAYKVCAYVETSWGKKVPVKTATYKVKKAESAKNGWFYEKYNGKVYKFYYKDNEKVTDLTKILGLSPSSASNTNNFYIEINRAACCVTVYAYDKEKKSYCIPVRTFTVSVGRDTSSTGSASSLTEDTSYTPLGDYSVCSNGISVKYSVKQMHEPDGSICYARWATHIVGNVYFHSIAVGSDSHYALSPTTYNRLGGPASAGCIRMMVADAKWIYDYVSTGSKVKIVKGDSSHPGPLGKAKTIKVTGSINYDPTDPEVPDSRKIADYKAGRISGYRTKAGKKIGY